MSNQELFSQGGGGLVPATQTIADDFDVCGALSDGAHNGGGLNGQDAYTGRVLPVARTLLAKENDSHAADLDTYLTVAHALRGEGFDASEDGTGRGTPILPVCFDSKGSQVQFSDDGEAPTLRSISHAGSHQNGGGQLAVAFDTTQITSKSNFSSPKVGDPCHPIAAAAHPAAVAFDMRGREGGAMPEGPHDTANIRAASGGSSRSYLAQPWAVRRLTPRECERLQGFPDDFTDVPWHGKSGSPDGRRFKALGNSMAVNVMGWIGERIQAIEDLRDVA